MNRDLDKMGLQWFSDADETKETEEPGSPTLEEQIDELKATVFQLKKNQSDADKIRKNYSDKLKGKDTEIEELKTLHMDEKERLAHEQKKKEDEIERERAENKRDRLEIIAHKKLVEVGLPIEFAEMVMGADEESTLKNVDLVAAVISERIEAVVKEKLKEFGFKPDGSGGGEPPTTITNPWTIENFNLTEQGKILKDDPALAKKLQAEAKAKTKGKGKN